MQSAIALLQNNTPGLKNLVLGKKIFEESPQSYGEPGGKELLDAVAANTTLQSLDFGGNSLRQTNKHRGGQSPETEALTKLLRILEVNRTLTNLHLDFCGLGSTGALLLASGLRQNSSLVVLSCSRNNMQAKGAAAIFEALKTDRKLATLNLRSNKISADCAGPMADFLCCNTTLKTLELWNNDLGAATAVLLADVLLRNKTLRALGLRQNSIGVQFHAIKIFAQAFCDPNFCPSLTAVDLRDNLICSEGIAEISRLLAVNSTLEALDLGENALGATDIFEHDHTSDLHRRDSGLAVGMLGSALKQNPSAKLRCLKLFGNELGPAGAALLADTLKSCTTLEDINLGCNRFTADGMGVMADGLQSNVSLTRLNLESNRLLDSGVAMLASALTANKSDGLLDLNLGYNGVAVGGMAPLSNYLAGCALTKLNLQANYVSNDGAALLGEAMRAPRMSQGGRARTGGARTGACACLASLNLRDNNIGAAGAVALGAGLVHAKALTHLNLSENLLNSTKTINIGTGTVGGGMRKGQVKDDTGPYSGEKGVQALAAALLPDLDTGRYARVKTLLLERCGIGPRGAEHMAQVLQHNTRLTDLSLAHNDMGAEGGGKLAGAMAANSRLEKLSLAGDSLCEALFILRWNAPQVYYSHGNSDSRVAKTATYTPARFCLKGSHQKVFIHIDAGGSDGAPPAATTTTTTTATATGVAASSAAATATPMAHRQMPPHLVDAHAHPPSPSSHSPLVKSTHTVASPIRSTAVSHEAAPPTPQVAALAAPIATPAATATATATAAAAAASLPTLNIPSLADIKLAATTSADASASAHDGGAGHGRGHVSVAVAGGLTPVQLSVPQNAAGLFGSPRKQQPPQPQPAKTPLAEEDSGDMIEIAL